MERKINNLLRMAFNHGKNDMSEKQFQEWLKAINKLEDEKKRK